EQDNFGALVLDIEARLTREERQGGEVQRRLNDQDGMPHDFDGLIAWSDAALDASSFSKHHTGTKRKFQRRLLKLVHEGDGTLRRDDPGGTPLNARAGG